MPPPNTTEAFKNKLSPPKPIPESKRDTVSASDRKLKESSIFEFKVGLIARLNRFGRMND